MKINQPEAKQAKDLLVAVEGSLKWQSRTCVLNNEEIKR